jgi:2,3-bisphosphoglycerate-independent phosphoglycerate mutase
MLTYAKINKSTFLGLVSDGGVHLSTRLIDTTMLQKFFVHAFTDGRDVDPKSGKHYIQDYIANTTVNSL